MLKAMRQHAKYLYFLFFIVILTFIFWGVGTVDQSSTAQIVAEVGKHRISAQDYARVYDNYYRLYRDVYQEKFDEEMQNSLKLKDKSIESLVGQSILLIAAEEHGIKVSDSEVKEAILNEPAFTRNGVFDSEIYQNTLRLSRLTPGIYESKKREELVIQKMSRLIQTAAPAPDAGLEGISADEQTKKMIMDAMAKDAQEKVVLSFIEGMKKRVKVKIYTELL